MKATKSGLNPCCSGRWSRTPNAWYRSLKSSGVLILVVVEDGLVLYGRSHTKFIVMAVLILVVVEDGLVHC